jgi:ribonuclease P protein component
VQSDALVLHARQRNRDEATPNGARLAVIAVRRFPTAVARNRARRIVREASRVLLKDVGGSWDLALVVRTEALDQPYQDRLATLADLFRRAGVVSGQAVALR